MLRGGLPGVRVRRARFSGREVRVLELNGEPGAVMSHDGMSDAAITVGVVDGRVQQVWLVRNPDKLTTLPAIPS